MLYPSKLSTGLQTVGLQTVKHPRNIAGEFGEVAFQNVPILLACRMRHTLTQ